MPALLFFWITALEMQHDPRIERIAVPSLLGWGNRFRARHADEILNAYAHIYPYSILSNASTSSASSSLDTERTPSISSVTSTSQSSSSSSPLISLANTSFGHPTPCESSVSPTTAMIRNARGRVLNRSNFSKSLVEATKVRLLDNKVVKPYHPDNKMVKTKRAYNSVKPEHPLPRTIGQKQRMAAGRYNQGVSFAKLQHQILDANVNLPETVSRMNSISVRAFKKLPSSNKPDDIEKTYNIQPLLYGKVEVLMSSTLVIKHSRNIIDDGVDELRKLRNGFRDLVQSACWPEETYNLVEQLTRLASPMKTSSAHRGESDETWQRPLVMI
ncbi:hypothetical protein K458DRAFT_381563 [Lentithecium fluviatile CBS 122367]|uniref:Uncharacterized protein n=1 Tax=Lentithecium fluviatile CBS 122367 TaxID=1168545 RepID=A0A6G1JNA3_9PLEO|nr:hypothetical protein K458DRAFT_381563 [Lentithecium fluviatile CBS 122367]